jgi:hypothetical protein
MQAVMAFASRAATRAASAAASSGGGKGPWTGKSLGGLSRGLSALGSISEYASARQDAAALDQQARDEEMAGRQEYIQATERVAEIDDAFNRLVADQSVAAAGMGIDVGSGSVVEARRTAQAEADRERLKIRNAADANAKVRRVRALAYREGAKNARFGATLKLGMDLVQAFA